MERPLIPEPLADRYGSTTLLALWTPQAKIRLERELWLTVLAYQLEADVDALKNVPANTVNLYRDVIDNINLDDIREREMTLRHDVKARIESFNATASEHAGETLELIHRGLTSRDLTENVEQAQIYRSLKLIERKVIAVFGRLIHLTTAWQSQAMVGRSHNVAAQVTTLGKRFASTAEELIMAHERLVHVIDHYRLRGIKGPMGTQQDMLEQLKDDEHVAELEERIAKLFDIPHAFESVGQVYPRTLDQAVVDTLKQLAAVESSFATTLRLMAGNELVTEGFKPGQVGSSAMPHKMNARTSERICGFYSIMRGYSTMIDSVAGNQWNEGDVSCSVVRRKVFPECFMAADGMLESWLTVLDEFGAYPAMMGRELGRYLPFLATTKLLAAAQQNGMGREAAHELIKEHAVKAALSMRERGDDENPLFITLGNDPRFPLDKSEIKASIGKPVSFAGLSVVQAKAVVSRMENLCANRDQDLSYKPEKIL